MRAPHHLCRKLCFGAGRGYDCNQTLLIVLLCLATSGVVVEQFDAGGMHVQWSFAYGLVNSSLLQEASCEFRRCWNEVLVIEVQGKARYSIQGGCVIVVIIVLLTMRSLPSTV